MVKGVLNRVVAAFFGVILIILGLDVFFRFIVFPRFNYFAAFFLSSLGSVGYIFTLMGMVFLITGILYIVNVATGLSSVLLIPFSFNMILFHFFLDSTGFFVAFVVFLLNLWMFAADWRKFRVLFGQD
tara:strand:+ start:545 stop:928 length:384 start_codon:yes stop_codon:yes gene_type:complete